jgi:hypothetical protein
MPNWGGPLYETFQNDSKHVVHIESCGKSDNKGGCNKITLIDNNMISKILHGGSSAK